MVEVKMLARSVGRSDARAVVQLQAVPDPNNEEEAGGTANIIVNDPDALDEFEEGQVYWVTFEKADAADHGPVVASLVAPAAAGIQNSTNTRGYKTPPELKVPPPLVPDGVVTEPRPTVVMPPVEGTAPPTAGVVSGPADNPATPAKK